MPDLLLVFAKRWKLIALITALATIIALIVALLLPKKYLAVSTALPANSMIADKARIFNQNIQALYSEFGTVDELDKLEGTGKLDTLFIAAVDEFKLEEHYRIGTSDKSLYDAAIKLKKNSRINRSGYGELKVRVWDKDKILCAQLANFLMKKLQEMHQHLQNQANLSVLEKVKEAYALRQKEFMQLTDSVKSMSVLRQTRMSTLREQLQSYEKMMDEYQLVTGTNTPVLLVVEPARPAIYADQPKIAQNVLLGFFGAFVFSFLLALFLESRKAIV
ncbi:MAG TPA: Wzz/FepE/Etk N-terminal domain-containing protein [Flavisolibacter sp.]|nr:Wzz/FepE/Etk N-terminal domain-containing protein [Flavisolibacter sp.]